MSEFKGMKKEELDKLQKAVRAWTALTGEQIDISGIPELTEETEDPEAAAERAKEELAAQAETTRKLEEAARAQRRAAMAQNPPDEDSEYTGPGQPAPITERARQQGLAPAKGSEPETVSGRKSKANEKSHKG
jgi:uncharacterized membrane protein YdfJ with MMPL/SSD domain